MPVFLHAAIAVVLAWSAAIWLLYPVLRPRGDVNTRAKRGLQFSAYAASFVAGATATRAISNVDHVDLWIAVAVLTPLAWIAAFAVGYVIGPSSSIAASVPLSATAKKVPASMRESVTPQMSVVRAEELWSLALTEFEGNLRRPGLWAKSFAEAGGNEAVAKANYLKWRVDELTSEENSRVEQSLRAQLAEDERRRLATLTEEQRAYALLPKGICPSCDTTLLLASESCPNCLALFGAHSSWSIRPIRAI